MKFTDYLKDKILLVIVQIFCMLLLTGFLYATGYPLETCRVIFTGLGRNIFRMVFMGILQQKTVLPANRNDFGKGG